MKQSPATRVQAAPAPLARNRIAVEYRSLSTLTPDPKNPRVHSERQIRQIARSIQAFGFNSPVAIDRDGRILAGHGRVEAAKRLGISDVPIVCLSHLSAAAAKAFLIADNRLAELAAWDRPLLMEIFEVLQHEPTFDLEITGFDMAEIDLLLEGQASLSDEPEEEVSPEGPPITQPGDLWRLGAHRILCANALDRTAYEQLMEGQKAAVVFTDPPYNVKVASIAGLGRATFREFAMANGEMSRREFIDFLAKAFDLLVRHAAAGSIHFICMDWRHFDEVSAAAKDAYDEQLNLCVWAKDTPGMGSLYRSSHELVFVFRAGNAAHRNNIQLGRFGRNRSNVWTYPSPRSFGGSGDEREFVGAHPTPKPVALIADALMDVSCRGDLVLDPFLGSGSTLIAAERVGRIGYGIELDPSYVDLAVRRWQHLTGRDAVHGRTGATYSTCASEVAGHG